MCTHTHTHTHTHVHTHTHTHTCIHIHTYMHTHTLFLSPSLFLSLTHSLSLSLSPPPSSLSLSLSLSHTHTHTHTHTCTHNFFLFLSFTYGRQFSFKNCLLLLILNLFTDVLISPLPILTEHCEGLYYSEILSTISFTQTSRGSDPLIETSAGNADSKQLSVAVALAVHGTSPLFNMVCTLYCTGQQGCVSAVWVRFRTEYMAGSC